jgi:hypothetical protein
MQILNQNKLNNRGVKIVHQQVDFFVDPQIKFKTVIGIDPGTAKLGVTLISFDVKQIHLHEFTFPSERLAIPRAVRIRLALTDVFYMDPMFSFMITPFLVAVEGSSFGSVYRNTELAESRITEAMWFMDQFRVEPENCVFIPPLTIRKQVFGNGKLRAEEQWPELEPDAASSLAVAIAGLKLNT